MASRLSFTLWDSLPDDVLLAAAAAGQLRTRDKSRLQARRMTSDTRFDGKLREFFLQWLKIDQQRDLRKDAAQFPEFNAAVAADLRTSLELFLEDVLGDERADFRKLLLADYLFLNGRLAPLYGCRYTGRGPVSKGHGEAQRACGNPLASVSDVRVCRLRRVVPDSSRSIRDTEPVRSNAQATPRGRDAGLPVAASRSDDARTDRAPDKGPDLPVLSLADQSTGICA